MKIRFFELANRVSKLSNHKRYQIGSVITKGSTVISVGFNQLKTHPKSTHPYKNLHAEMSAILLSKTDLSGCDLYVYRATKDKVPAIAKPCVYCMELIKLSGIKHIHFSNNGEFQTMEVS